MQLSIPSRNLAEVRKSHFNDKQETITFRTTRNFERRHFEKKVRKASKRLEGRSLCKSAKIRLVTIMAAVIIHLTFQFKSRDLWELL